jgi:hypothetical protein
MENRQRLTKWGIVALAGVAVLGWVREPEKHHSSGYSVSATSPADSAQSRRTFYPPAEHPGLGRTGELPGYNPGPVPAGDTPRATNSRGDFTPTIIEDLKPSPAPGGHRNSPVVKTPQRSSANSGRHEDPQIAEDDVVTRSQEPQRERSEDRRIQGSEGPQIDGAPMPRADRTDDNARAQTQPVVGKKARSTARSTAIIVGTAVAGAAIGAVTGGGKGAAIGAISGSAGGYVYDRMTRHIAGAPGVTDRGSNSRSDADQQADYQRYDRGSSLARRFGTPRFN